jgi:hypothetical protein
MDWACIDFYINKHVIIITNKNKQA